jgi:hypothetical protein
MTTDCGHTIRPTLRPMNKSSFAECRRDLIRAGLATQHDDAIICPLCWKEVTFAELSVEHIPPASVGGTAKTLTCRRCNNEHGSAIDSHLAQSQVIADAFGGRGTIPTTLRVNGHAVRADLEWLEQAKHFEVVGKASNPRSSDKIKEAFLAGEASELEVSLELGYAPDKCQTALVRAAYLALFKRFGYSYAKGEVVQVLRRRICDPLLNYPRLGSLIVELREGKPPADEPYIIVAGDVNKSNFFLVILRVRKATTKRFGVFMPGPTEEGAVFFELMERCSREHNHQRLTIPAQAIMPR